MSNLILREIEEALLKLDGLFLEMAKEIPFTVLDSIERAIKNAEKQIEGFNK